MMYSSDSLVSTGSPDVVTYIYIYTYKSLYIYKCIHSYIYVYICIYIYVYIYVYMCMYANTHLDMFSYVYIFPRLGLQRTILTCLVYNQVCLPLFSKEGSGWHRQSQGSPSSPRACLTMICSLAKEAPRQPQQPQSMYSNDLLVGKGSPKVAPAAPELVFQ